MSGEVVARTRRQSDRHSRWRRRTLGQEPGECLEYDSQGPRWESRKSPRSETAALTESSTFDEQCGHAPCGLIPTLQPRQVAPRQIRFLDGRGAGRSLRGASVLSAAIGAGALVRGCPRPLEDVVPARRHPKADGERAQPLRRARHPRPRWVVGRAAQPAPVRRRAAGPRRTRRLCRWLARMLRRRCEPAPPRRREPAR